MKKIYLFCDAGMSTSMMAQRMQEVADKNKLPFEIKAFGTRLLPSKLEEGLDCVLLGPQVRHTLGRTEELAKPYKVPVGVLDSEDYGLMDGERALKKTILLMKKFKEENK